ncbi:MAG: hypothetical protein JWN78_1899, partial [Bacteroidota bacterium]|nr:hypothetical protein [Bacteroidota bacterium]
MKTIIQIFTVFSFLFFTKAMEAEELGL